jgi:hypothetical protein
MRGPTAFSIVCALLFTLAVASSALADTALFRVEQRWHHFPAPPVTTPGGAGLYQGYIQPYYVDTPHGNYLFPPAKAIVEPGNPVGGAFTLPQSFYAWTYSSGAPYTPAKTGWPGHTTSFYYLFYNGPGKFGPGFGSTASNLRVVFPTTGGNPTPNYGLGNPVTPTNTFDGRYDMSRGGSIHVTPGPNRFGGTWRLFFYDRARWIQNIFISPPNYYYGYGSYFCFDDGMYDCTPDTFVSEPGTTAIYNGVWWLLTDRAASPVKAAGYKATVPIPAPRYSTFPTPTPLGSNSYLRRSQHYLNLIHPWTTGSVKVYNAKGSPPARIWLRRDEAHTISPAAAITPQAQGYDISLGGATVSVKKYNWNINWNSTLNTLTTTTSTPYTQVLKGVTRVVSMVRPRLIHTYKVPIDPAEPIENIRQTARLWRLKVFFLPEPAGMLLLGAGLGCLAVLHRLRQRG